MPVLSKRKWAYGISDSDDEEECKRSKVDDQTEDDSNSNSGTWSVKQFLARHPIENADSVLIANDMRMVNSFLMHGDTRENRRRWHNLMDTPGLYSNWCALTQLSIHNWNDFEEYLSTGRAKTLLAPDLRKLAIRSSNLEWAEWIPWLKKSPMLTHLVMEGCLPGEKFSNGDGMCLPSILYVRMDHLAISSSQFQILSEKINPNLVHLDLTLGLSTRRYNSIKILELIGTNCHSLTSLRVVFGVVEERCRKQETLNRVNIKNFQKALDSLQNATDLNYLSVESIGYYLPFDKLTDENIKKLVSSHNFFVVQMFEHEDGHVTGDSFSHLKNFDLNKSSSKMKIFLPGASFVKLTEPVEPFSPLCKKLIKL